jgi:hypothetical protein
MLRRALHHAKDSIVYWISLHREFCRAMDFVMQWMLSCIGFFCIENGVAQGMLSHRECLEDVGTQNMSSHRICRCVENVVAQRMLSRKGCCHT